LLRQIRWMEVLTMQRGVTIIPPLTYVYVGEDRVEYRMRFIEGYNLASVLEKIDSRLLDRLLSSCQDELWSKGAPQGRAGRPVTDCHMPEIEIKRRDIARLESNEGPERLMESLARLKGLLQSVRAFSERLDALCAQYPALGCWHGDLHFGNEL